VTWKEGLALAPLIALVFWIGFYPRTLLEPMEASVSTFIHDFQQKLIVSNDGRFPNDEPRLADWPRRIAPGRDEAEQGEEGAEDAELAAAEAAQ
jgi:hypothetical protein